VIRRSLVLALLLGACFVSKPEPVRYVVVRGDTLGEIATAHGVTVDELRAWNDLEGDLIEVDQVLLIHTSGADASEAEPTRSASSARRPAAAPAPAAEQGLSMPEPKPCLDPPSMQDAQGEAEMIGSQGLSSAQVKAAFGAFAPRTTSCLPSGWTGSASPTFELLIGCDGLVRQVSVASPSGLPQPVLDCLTDRLRYAPFPAHDLPDGERARVPLHLVGTPPEPTEADGQAD